MTNSSKLETINGNVVDRLPPLHNNNKSNTRRTKQIGFGFFKRNNSNDGVSYVGDEKAFKDDVDAMSMNSSCINKNYSNDHHDSETLLSLSNHSSSNFSFLNGEDGETNDVEYSIMYDPKEGERRDREKHWGVFGKMYNWMESVKDDASTNFASLTTGFGEKQDTNNNNTSKDKEVVEETPTWDIFGQMHNWFASFGISTPTQNKV